MLSITDNPGGHAMLYADALGTDLISSGQEVILHPRLQDWNRNALDELRGWQLSSAGFHQKSCAMSGDYPVMGHQGSPRPSSISTRSGSSASFSDMNAGLPDGSRQGARLDDGLLPRRSGDEPQAARA